MENMEKKMEIWFEPSITYGVGCWGMGGKGARECNYKGTFGWVVWRGRGREQSVI